MPKVVSGYREAAKAKIIETAGIVFSKKGYHDATMDDIAKELGVSKGALYSYFGSKEDLLNEISQQIHQILRNAVEKSSETQDLTIALESIYTNILGRCRDKLHTHFEIVASASHDQRIQKIIIDDYLRDMDTVRIFIDGKTNQGLIRTDVDSDTLTQLSISLFLGTMAMLAIGFDDKWVHDNWLKSMLLILKQNIHVSNRNDVVM